MLVPQCARVDIDGTPLRVGDKVLVIAVPTSIAKLDRDAKAAFSLAVGKTLQTLGFGEDGAVELDMTPPRFRGWDTIWVEPFLVRRIVWSPVQAGRKAFNNSFKARRRRTVRPKYGSIAG